MPCGYYQPRAGILLAHRQEVDRIVDDQEIMKILTDCGVVREGHFVGTSGKHLDHYFDKNRLFRNPVAFERLCEELATRCYRGDEIIEVVIAPAIGGAFVGQRLAYHLARLQGIPVDFVFAERPDGIFVIKRGQDQGLLLHGNALAVEDVITTGLSIREGAIDIARSLKLDVVAAATLCNRGQTSEDIGANGPIHALLDIAWPSWAATEEDPCLLCQQDVLINTDVGHGQEFLDKKTGTHRIQGGMPRFS